MPEEAPIDPLALLGEAEAVHAEIESRSWAHGASGGDIDTLDDDENVIEILASYGASWLVDHLRPLQTVLDHLAGMPGVIVGYSELWLDTAEELVELSTELEIAIDSETPSWIGEAADGYWLYAIDQVDLLRTLALASGGVGVLTRIVGEVVAEIRERVRELLVDLVRRLIEWVLENVNVVGFASGAFADEVEGVIQETNSQIVEQVEVLRGNVDAGNNLLAKLRDIFGDAIAGYAAEHTKRKGSKKKTNDKHTDAEARRQKERERDKKYNKKKGGEGASGGKGTKKERKERRKDEKKEWGRDKEDNDDGGGGAGEDPDNNDDGGGGGGDDGRDDEN